MIGLAAGIHDRPKLNFDLPTGNILNSHLGPEVEKFKNKRIKLTSPNPVPDIKPAKVASSNVCEEETEKENHNFQDISSLNKSKRRSKFKDNQITSDLKNVMDEHFVKKINSTSSQFGEITLKDVYHQCRRTREDVVIIKNLLLGSKTTESEWAQIKDSFPFVLPLDNEDDAAACENYISISNDNKEKLVSFTEFFNLILMIT